MPLNHLQERWHFHKRMNKKVTYNLERLQSIAAQSQSKQDILDALHPWQTSTTLSFNNSFCYLYVMVAVFLFGIGMLMPGPIQILLWVIAIALVVFAYLAYEKQSQVDRVIQQLNDTIFQFEYKLRFAECPIIDQVMMNPSYILMKVRQNFPCLNQGNTDNKLVDFAATTWQVEGYDYPVLLFHYIAVSKIVMRDHKGEKYRKKVETHHWGACVFHMPALAFVVSNEDVDYEGYPIRWTSSDIQFNQRYRIYGQQEFELAKNFSPHRIITLVQNLQQMEGQLMFHEQIQAFCYLSTQNIFQYQMPKENITDISQLRGYLRTFYAPNYETMQKSLTAIIASFKDDLAKPQS